MADLFRALGPFQIYNTAEVVQQPEIPAAQFLEGYHRYAEPLQNGKIPDEQQLRRLFSSALSKTGEAFYAMEVGPGRYLVKPILPVVQMQLHHFLASETDGKFYPMVFGIGSVTWGIQFSYPQIYQNPKSHTFAKVVDSPEFPNTRLFIELVRWLRSYTVPTTFVHGGKKTATAIRLGKRCLPWIGRHAGLVQKGVSVYVY